MSHSFYDHLSILSLKLSDDCVDNEDSVDADEDQEEGDLLENLSPLPNLRTYGVINVVIIVTTPTIGKLQS